MSMLLNCEPQLKDYPDITIQYPNWLKSKYPSTIPATKVIKLENNKEVDVIYNCPLGITVTCRHPEKAK